MTLKGPLGRFSIRTAQGSAIRYHVRPFTKFQPRANLQSERSGRSGPVCFLGPVRKILGLGARFSSRLENFRTGNADKKKIRTGNEAGATF